MAKRGPNTTCLRRRAALHENTRRERVMHGRLGVRGRRPSRRHRNRCARPGRCLDQAERGQTGLGLDRPRRRPTVRPRPRADRRRRRPRPAGRPGPPRSDRGACARPPSHSGPPAASTSAVTSTFASRSLGSQQRAVGTRRRAAPSAGARDLPTSAIARAHDAAGSYSGSHRKSIAVASATSDACGWVIGLHSTPPTTSASSASRPRYGPRCSERSSCRRSPDSCPRRSSTRRARSSTRAASAAGIRRAHRRPRPHHVDVSGKPGREVGEVRRRSRPDVLGRAQRQRAGRAAERERVEQPGGELGLLGARPGCIGMSSSARTNHSTPASSRARAWPATRRGHGRFVVDVEPGRDREPEAGAESLCVRRERPKVVELGGVVRRRATVAVLRVVLRRVHVRVHAARRGTRSPRGGLV